MWHLNRIIVASLVFWFSAAHADKQLSEQIDDIFAGLSSKDTPGCAVAVVRDGEFIHKRGYGMANLEHDVPITADTVFRVGSVSKQFTAAAIALLADQGKLDLDADIHTYLDDLIPYSRPVSLRQVIAHTADMQDYTPQAFDPLAKNIAGNTIRWGNKDYLSIEEFYQLVRQVPLVPQPEDQPWRYSNLGYFLLSQVVERVSGHSLAEFARAEIFVPLGMRDTRFNDNVNQLIGQRADGYHVPADGGSIERFETNLDFVGDGGIYTTLNDFIRWDQSFYQPIMGNDPKAFVELLQAPLATLPVTKHTPDGWIQRYAFGQAVIDGVYPRFYSHGGSWVGFRAFYERHPHTRTSFFGFCNRDDANIGAYQDQLRELLIPRLMD